MECRPTRLFSRKEYWSGLPCPPPGSSQPTDQTHMSCFLNCKACFLPLSHLGSPTTEALTIYHSSTLSNFSYSHLILMVKLALCLFFLKQAIKHKNLNNLLIVTQLISGSPETQSQVVWLKGPYFQKLLPTMMNTHSVPRILLFPVREKTCAASPDNNCPQISPAITHTCTKSFSMIMLTPHFHMRFFKNYQEKC